MRRYILYMLFLLCSGISFSQQGLPIGVGVLRIDYMHSPVLYFYSDTTQTRPTRVIAIDQDREGDFTIKDQNKASWFQPEQIALDYNIFIIRVDKVYGRWYRVITNSNNGRMMWTKASPEKEFIRWPSFLVKETTAVAPGNNSLEIKEMPGSNSKTIRRAGKKDCYEALEIKGDWMRIRTNTILGCDESNSPIKSGWINWRRKGRLMIEFFLTC